MNTTVSDVDLGSRFLAGTATHEHRTPEQLMRWARIALDYGDELADAHPRLPELVVTERQDGRRKDEVLLAEYRHRQRSVTLYADSLDFAVRTCARRGWRLDRAALRQAAVAHEVAHHLMHGPRTRELNQRLGHHALKAGPLRVRGHVAGADELVAHRYAQLISGLDRSPLLLNTYLTDALSGA